MAEIDIIPFVFSMVLLGIGFGFGRIYERFGGFNIRDVAVLIIGVLGCLSFILGKL